MRHEVRAPAAARALLLVGILTGGVGFGQCPPPDGPVLRVLVVSGDPAPGLDGVSLVGPSGAQWGAWSDVGFFSQLHGPGADETRTQALWVPGRGAPRFVVAEGDPVPGVGPEAFFGGSLPLHYLGPRGDAIVSLRFRSPALGWSRRLYGAVDRG